MKLVASRTVAQIQTLLKGLGFYSGNVDGGYGPLTSQAVARFQYSRWLKVDGGWGIASDGTGFPVGTAFGVDYSFARPDPAQLASRGVKFALRYLYQLTWSQGVSKGLSRAEFDALLAAGIKVPAYLYEESAEDIISGFEVGAAQARKAEEHRIREGLPFRPIIFNVDKSVPDSALPGIIEGLKGAASVIGPDRVWVYGGYNVVKAAFDAGVISGAFQTYAWSNGQWDPRAQFQQWSNGQWGDIGLVDFCRATVAL